MEIDMEAVREEAMRMARGFQSIGEFLFQFSQLEFTIRAVLAGELGLSNEQFDVVTGPYDFAMLCKVTRKILTQKYPEKEKRLEEFFKACYGLNDERVKIAHGLWSDNGYVMSLRHVSRSSLNVKFHYQNPDELSGLTAKAQDLMQQTLMLGRAIG